MFNFIRKAKETIEMKIIAALIERVFKNYVTTVLGILLGFTGVVAAVYNLIPSTLVWQGHNVANTLLEIASVALALAGAIAKDKNIGINTPTLPTKVGMILLMLSAGMLFPASARAQLTLTASSDAVAFHYNNEWTAASHTAESVNFLDWGKTKENHLFLDGHEFLASSENLQIYAGGLTYQPDLSTVLKKTNFSSDNLAVNFSAAIGNGLITSGATSKSNISFLAGGQVKYKATSALTYNAAQFLYERVGSKNGWSISTGLAFIFGQ